MGTPDEQCFCQEFPADEFNNSKCSLFDKILVNNINIPSSFCSPTTEDGESPVSVLGYPPNPTPISAIECPRASSSYEFCVDPSFTFSGPWVDLDKEMELWMNKLTQPPPPAAAAVSYSSLSHSPNYTTDQQLDLINPCIQIPQSVRSALDSSEPDLIAECYAERKGVDVGSASEVLTAVNFAKKQNKKKTSKKPRITQRTISRIDLEQQFGKTRKEAASCLDVSVATLKRTARQCGIPRWPFNKKSKGLNSSANLNICSEHNSCAGNQSAAYLVVAPVSTTIEQIPDSGETAPPWSDTPPPKQLATKTTVVQISPPEAAKQDEKPMTMKVKYQDDFVKFEISSVSTMVDLEEEIVKRLKIKVGSFVIKYWDEDGDWVLISCDDDLQYCMRSVGKTTIKMLVQPNTN